jgi:hypothetical protein
MNWNSWHEAADNLVEHRPSGPPPMSFMGGSSSPEIYYKQGVGENTDTPIAIRFDFRLTDTSHPNGIAPDQLSTLTDNLRAATMAEQVKAMAEALVAERERERKEEEAKAVAEAERVRKREEDKARKLRAKERAKERENEQRPPATERTDEEKEEARQRAADAQRAEDERVAEVAAAERAKVAAQRAEAAKANKKLTQAEIFAKAKREKEARERALAEANPNAKGKGKGKGKGKAPAAAAASNANEAGPSGLPPIRQVVEDVFQERPPPKKGKGKKPN